MESNTLKKSANNCVVRFFCTYSFDDLKDSQNLLCCGSIFLKAVLIFPKDMIDDQAIP